MSYWDSSALVKLYVKEADSAQFEGLALVEALVTGILALHEARTVFRRREAEGVLPLGQGTALFVQLASDVAVGEIRVQTETDVVRGKFGEVLEACFSQTPAVFIRTNDALHIASALVAGKRNWSPPTSGSARERCSWASPCSHRRVRRQK